MRLMEETETKRGKIGELVGFIEGRLAELEEEKEELREWSEADKERRCLEYALFSGELEDLVSALEEIEEVSCITQYLEQPALIFKYDSRSEKPRFTRPTYARMNSPPALRKLLPSPMTSQVLDKS
jgi:hypothetical protein